MKFTVTDIDGPNEPLMISKVIEENYYLQSFFGDYSAQISREESTLSSEFLAYSEEQIEESDSETFHNEVITSPDVWSL